MSKQTGARKATSKAKRADRALDRMKDKGKLTVQPVEQEFAQLGGKPKAKPKTKSK